MATLTFVMLYVDALVWFLAAGVFGFTLAKGGIDTSSTDAALRSLWQALAVSGLTTLLTVVTAVFFCIWFFRSYQNLLALGHRETSQKLFWAPLGFFVPILNFFYPYSIAKEIWVRSDPTEVAGAAPGWKWGGAKESAPLVGLWWGFFLGGHLVPILSRIVVGEDKEFSPGGIVFSIVQAALYTVAALLGAVMVRGIEKRQRQRHEALQRRDQRLWEEGRAGAAGRQPSPHDAHTQ